MTIKIIQLECTLKHDKVAPSNYDQQKGRALRTLLAQYLDHVHQQTSFRSVRMEVGKVRSTLLREQGFNGTIMTRAAYAEMRVSSGNVEIDYKRKHYKNTATGTLFLFSDVTLAVVDYTEWLLSRKGAS